MERSTGLIKQLLQDKTRQSSCTIRKVHGGLKVFMSGIPLSIFECLSKEESQSPTETLTIRQYSHPYCLHTLFLHTPGELDPREVLAFLKHDIMHLTAIHPALFNQ